MIYTINLYEQYRWGLSKKLKAEPEKSGVLAHTNARGTTRHFLSVTAKRDGTKALLPQHKVFHVIDSQVLWIGGHKKVVYTLLYRGKDYQTWPMTEYAASMLFWNVAKQGALPKFMLK